jgi:hypothetical protein
MKLEPSSAKTGCSSLQRQRRKAAVVTASVSLIAVSHCLLQMVLYRGRVVDGWSVGDSGVLGAPAIAALLAYGVVLRIVARLWLVGAALGAFGLTCISFWAGMMLSLNLYGS